MDDGLQLIGRRALVTGGTKGIGRCGHALRYLAHLATHARVQTDLNLKSCSSQPILRPPRAVRLSLTPLSSSSSASTSSCMWSEDHLLQPVASPY